MAPASSTQFLPLSPAELSYLHSSLSLSPPIRPDGRTPTQLRPLIAETDILASANGSARVCFADGTEAVVGIKAEVEKSQWRPEHGAHLGTGGGDIEILGDDEDADNGNTEIEGKGENAWVEMSIDIPGFRDDDQLPVFLSAMLTEALLASGKLKDRLYINRRFHWKLYIDILLLSSTFSYPLPLLSLTTHLALLSSRLPRLKSELDEDPLFDDDWDASTFLYPLASGSPTKSTARTNRPPITLLVIAVGQNIIFDPSKEELAVAEAVVAVSVGHLETGEGLKLLAIRTIDPPSRLTPPGIPNSINSTTGGIAPTSNQDAVSQQEVSDADGVWRPPRGGIKRSLIGRIVKMALEKGGVGEEIMEGLANVES